MIKPGRIISLTRINPEPKTMAFGGVATGIIKARDDAMVGKNGQSDHPRPE